MAESEDGGSVTRIRDAVEDEAERLRSVEEMAEKGEGVEDEDQQQLLDFGDHLNLSIKGKRPTESKLKIKSVSKDITGQLGDKGDDEVYSFLVTGTLAELHVVNKRQDGRVIGKVRRHVLDPADVQRIPDDLAEKLTEDLEARG